MSLNCRCAAALLGAMTLIRVGEAAPQAPLLPTLSAKFLSSVEASAHGASSSKAGVTSIEVNAIGREVQESAGCKGAKAVASKASASALGAVTEIPTSETIGLRLKGSTTVSGGLKEVCPEFHLLSAFTFGGSASIVTGSVANALIVAIVPIDLRSRSSSNRYRLSVKDSQGNPLSSRIDVVLLDSDARAVNADVYKGADYVIDADRIYTLRLSETVHGFNSSVSSSTQDIRDDVRVTLSPLHRVDAKIASSEIDVHPQPAPLSTGATDDTFDAVGAIVLDANRVWCSGTIIGSRTILTAGHCIDGSENLLRHDVTFVLGKSALNPSADRIWRVPKKAWRIPQNEIPGISFDKLIPADDVGLMYVDRDFAAVGAPPNSKLPAPKINPAYDDSMLREAQQNHYILRLVGYGFGSPNPIPGAPAQGVNDRRYIELAVDESSTKSFKFGNSLLRACHGDSGGPVLYPPTVKDAQIVGIVSTGYHSPGTVPLSNPEMENQCYDTSIMTRIDVFIKWIVANLDKSPVSQSPH